MLSILYTVVVGLTVAASSKTEEQNCTMVIDLCFVLDSSKSVCSSDPSYNPATDTTCNNWKQMIDFMYNTTLELDIGENATRIAAIVFGSKAYARWRLPKYSDKQSLLAAIRNLQFIAGNTNTSGALDVARDLIFGTDARKNATKVMIIVTDGKAQNLTAVQHSIEKTHHSRILTIAVGISNAIDKAALKQLASDPKEENKTYWYVTGFGVLGGIRSAIQTVICHDLPFIAANYTTTTAAPSSSQVCASKIDIVFVLDRSESICRSNQTYKRTDEGCDNWKAMLSFVHRFIDKLYIGPNNIRVAVVAFSTKANQQFPLDRYQDSVSLGQAIDRIKYTAGSTNTSGGLDVMNYKAFGSRAREDAKKAAVIITDGRPTDPYSVQPAIDRTHAANIVTFAVGVTEQINEDSLKQISSEPKLKNQNYFIADDFAALDTIHNAIETHICNAAPATTTTTTTTTTTKPLPTRATTTTPITSTTKAATAIAAEPTPFI